MSVEQPARFRSARRPVTGLVQPARMLSSVLLDRAARADQGRRYSGRGFGGLDGRSTLMLPGEQREAPHRSHCPII